MDTPPGFIVTEVPARLADLGLTFVRPNGWVLVDLPAETPDFGKPAAFAPLVVAMAPYAPIVFSVVARPAYEDGSLVQWLEFLARDQGFDPGAIEHETVVRHPAVACWAMQQSDGVLMRMRLVLFEDGGRLVQVSAMAPQPLWGSAHDTLRTMLASFTLAAPRGGTAALAPEGSELPATTFGPGAMSAPPPSPPPPKAPAEPVFTYAEDPAPPEPEPEPEPAGTHDDGDDDLEVGHYDAGKPASFASVARAADTATLLQEHELNQRLLQSGAGFSAPLVQDHGPERRCATVKAAALRAIVCVPYGWHVLDDTARTLVHDGRGGVQIAMSRRARAGLDVHTFLQNRWRELRADAPQAEARRVRCNGIDMLLVRNLPIENELLVQSWLVGLAPDDEFLVLRCTSRSEDQDRTLHLAVLLLLHTYCLDEEFSGPDWWQDAMRLERLGELAAAEQRILKAIDHLGAPAQVAHLYELRGNRLRSLGDEAGALAAYETSGDWMDRMAAGATSGGEGAALSLQRDEHRARLGLARYRSN